MHELAFLLQAYDSETTRRIATVLLAAIPIITVVVLVLVILPFWFICKKAGFSPWLSLLFVVPFGGVILVYVLAFAEWKVVPLQQVVMAPPPGYPPLPPQI